ncbi:hypothetical protein ma251 [Moumouvirus australiensis]|uniref:Uncharacterized protein n=1 Tax=Moumouvirus australiensis TaxID=2109587 RepID=A0A2P1EL91_9VIRU|nr:hypothetical protein QKC55_gp653 [Moumouvirus australiensis]AVL94637.1 hypothetical protein ma251 [Moumouvirus australiensis]
MDAEILDIVNFRKKMFGEIIPVNTKISHKFPDELRNFPFDKKNYNFLNLETDIAKYTKTPNKYWNKNYDHIDSITKLANKIHNDVKFFDIKKIINKTESKNVIKYHQKIYILLDVFLTINIDQKEKIVKLVKQLTTIAKKHKFLVRFSYYLAVYFIRFYYQNAELDKLKKTVRDKVIEFKNTKNINSYFTQHELDNYLLYLDAMN